MSNVSVNKETITTNKGFLWRTSNTVSSLNADLQTSLLSEGYLPNCKREVRFLLMNQCTTGMLHYPSVALCSCSALVGTPSEGLDHRTVWFTL